MNRNSACLIIACILVLTTNALANVPLNHDIPDNVDVNRESGVSLDPKNTAAVLYGFQIAQVDSISYLNVETKDLVLLPPPTYQPAIQLAELITSSLDPVRGILYTVGLVYWNQYPTSYLVGYSIVSGEILSVSPLTSLQTTTPDVRGIGVDTSKNIVYVMNALPTVIVAIDPFNNATETVYSSSTAAFVGNWATFDYEGGYAYMYGEIEGQAIPLVLRKVQLSNGAIIADLPLNGSNGATGPLPNALVWAPSLKTLLSVGFTSYEVAEVTIIDPETGEWTFLNVLREMEIKSIQYGLLAWDDKEQVLYVGGDPIVGVSIPLNRIVFNFTSTGITTFPEEYQVFHP